MDKMREEFEIAWKVSRSDDEGNLGGSPTRSKIDSERYAGDAAQFAWMWWKRSRAALRVELNSFVFSRDKNGEGGLMLPERVFKAMDDAGVSYK